MIHSQLCGHAPVRVKGLRRAAHRGRQGRAWRVPRSFRLKIFDIVSDGLYIGHVKILLHDRGENAVSYEEKGTWVYLGFVLWAVAGSVLKLVAYRRGL